VVEAARKKRRSKARREAQGLIRAAMLVADDLEIGDDVLGTVLEGNLTQLEMVIDKLDNATTKEDARGDEPDDAGEQPDGKPAEAELPF